MRCLRLFLASSLFVLLLAALNNMVFRYRNRTIIGANLANAGDEEISEEEEEDGRIPKVLILTRTRSDFPSNLTIYYLCNKSSILFHDFRSGSTFLGEMLSLNPGSAFVFEPLGCISSLRGIKWKKSLSSLQFFQRPLDSQSDQGGSGGQGKTSGENSRVLKGAAPKKHKMPN